MAPVLRKHKKKVVAGDFVSELKQRVETFKPKPINFRPKKVTKMKLQSVKLKPVAARILPPAPPKQQNIFQQLVKEGMAQKAKKLEANKNILEKYETNDDAKEFEKCSAIRKILGATDVYGRLQFLIEWEGAEGIVRDLVDAKVVNQKYPQDVISYYQRNTILIS